VLAECSFEFKFVYILSGWEGSASDSAVYEDARATDFRIPEGKYYLADAGYPNTDALLAPY
jgi:DDE superfamily endonuclease